MSLFTDRARTADLRAKTDVSYWRIPSKLLKQMAQEDAGGMLRLVENLLLIALERLEYTSRELATVFEISKTLARNLSMEDFSLEIIRQLIYSVPDVDAGVLYVWDEFTDEFESPGKPSLEKKHPLVRHAVEKNETFFAGEKDAADLLKGIIEVKCALVAPVADRKPQGILVLGDTKTCVQYPQSAMDLLNSVALQISGAIENIRSRQDMLARQSFERTRSGSVNW
jgi:GAF domain-containing protein